MRLNISKCWRQAQKQRRLWMPPIFPTKCPFWIAQWTGSDKPGSFQLGVFPSVPFLHALPMSLRSSIPYKSLPSKGISLMMELFSSLYSSINPLLKLVAQFLCLSLNKLRSILSFVSSRLSCEKKKLVSFLVLFY